MKETFAERFPPQGTSESTLNITQPQLVQLSCVTTRYFLEFYLRFPDTFSPELRRELWEELTGRDQSAVDFDHFLAALRGVRCGQLDAAFK